MGEGDRVKKLRRNMRGREREGEGREKGERENVKKTR